jgi:hypothetical protein
VEPSIVKKPLRPKGKSGPKPGPARSVRRARAANVAVFRPALARAGAPMHLVALRWEEGRLVQV